MLTLWMWRFQFKVKALPKQIWLPSCSNLVNWQKWLCPFTILVPTYFHDYASPQSHSTDYVSILVPTYFHANAQMSVYFVSLSSISITSFTILTSGYNKLFFLSSCDYRMLPASFWYPKGVYFASFPLAKQIHYSH